MAHNHSQTIFFTTKNHQLQWLQWLHGASTVRRLGGLEPKDVVRGIFEDLDIKPGDSNVVEAVLQLILVEGYDF